MEQQRAAPRMVARDQSEVEFALGDTRYQGGRLLAVQMDCAPRPRACWLTSTTRWRIKRRVSGCCSAKDANLQIYATGRALDGLRLMIGEGERKIRKNRVATWSAILKECLRRISLSSVILGRCA